MVMSFGELRKKFPDCYEALTLEQYQRLFTHWDLDKEVHERDYFKLITILAGFKIEDRTPEKEEAVYQLTRWINEQPFPYSKEVPKFVVIDNRSIEIPKELGGLSVGQNIMLRQLVDKSKYLEECFSMAIAIYLQPLFDKAPFSYSRAKEFERVIRGMKAKDMYGLGFFLSSRVMRSGWKPSKSLSRTLTSLKQTLKKMLLT